MTLPVNVRIEQRDDHYVAYLLDVGDRLTAYYDVPVHWPLTKSDRSEIAWACKRIGADYRTVSRQVRDALRARTGAPQSYRDDRSAAASHAESSARRFKQR